jgi:uncharacterized protein (DUF1684 family)
VLFATLNIFKGMERSMRLALLACVVLFRTAMTLHAEIPFSADEIQKWRATREERLRAENGWLTLTGRYPLKEGANRFGVGTSNDIVFPSELGEIGPDTLGTIDVNHQRKRVTLNLVDGITMTSGAKSFTGERVMGTATDKRDWVGLGRMSMHVIGREGKYVLRLADNESARRKNFKGCVWYPTDETFQVKATFVAFEEEKTLSIVNIIDEVSEQKCPGYAEFQLLGERHRLDAIKDGDGLFFVFRDSTAGDTTHPPGRFLDVERQPGSNESFILDFNKAYNPPCAFSEYTTCPLPPKQNILKLRIEAGEKYQRPE